MEDVKPLRKTRGKLVGDDAQFTLEHYVAGETVSAITEQLAARGCVVADRTVYAFLQRNKDRITEIGREVTAAAVARGFGVRGRRIEERGRIVEALIKKLSGNTPGDYAFLHGMSVPLAQEIDRQLKAIRDECNDIDPPRAPVDEDGKAVPLIGYLNDWRGRSDDGEG